MQAWVILSLCLQRKKENNSHVLYCSPYLCSLNYPASSPYLTVDWGPPRAPLPPRQQHRPVSAPDQSWKVREARFCPRWRSPPPYLYFCSAPLRWPPRLTTNGRPPELWLPRSTPTSRLPELAATSFDPPRLQSQFPGCKFSHSLSFSVCLRSEVY